MATDAPTTAGPGAEAEHRPFPRRDPDYRVILEEAAHRAILDHARSGPDVELCGVLAGDLYRDDDGPYLVITDAVRGREAKQGDTSVTFTQSTWERIHREMDTRHPGRRIVGWYHTHPGFGVFLSEVDLFAHRHFFDASWQVALVVDPKADQVGLFVWQGSEIVRARRFWIGEELRREAVPPADSAPPGGAARGRRDAKPAPAATDARSRDEADGWWNLAGFGALAVLCAVLAYLAFARDWQNARLASELSALRREADAESSALARALAFRLRERLDAGDPIEPRTRATYEAVERLDPARRAAYRLLLPELAPPPEPPRPEAAGGR